MAKKELDWGNIGFGYRTTDYRYVANFKDGQWQDGFLTEDATVVLNECAGILQYCQECFEGLKAYTTADGSIVTFRPDLNAQRMVESGKEEAEAAKAASKKAQEDARYVLYNACDTRIIVTMNIRSLYNFFKLRCCERAQWEIRALAEEMLRLVKAVSPALFKNAGPSCVKGKCTEGNMSCGKAVLKREYFKNLK